MNIDDGSDSDFYGQIENVARLEERVQLSDTESPGTTTQLVTQGVSAGIRKHAEQKLQNPFAGVAYAWQLGESVDDFVCRLPPATTVTDEHTPWIYICNPFIQRRKKTESGSQLVLGCGDEGPEAEGSHTVLFMEGAGERLNILSGFLGGMAKMGLPRRATSHDAESARQAAASDVLGLAGHLGVTCGKWMLFVRPGKVNEIWETVARATSQGELGIAAKVAPRDPAVDARGDPQRDHLICVYTADFRDATDAGRVLRRLEILGIIQRHQGEVIYYKCDAYTYLGIGAKNPWGLRASLFSSSDVFARLDGAGEPQVLGL